MISMQPRIVVLGGGAAGLSVGLNLLEKGFENVQIVFDRSGASIVSPWNILRADSSAFQKILLNVGCHRNDLKIVKLFAKNLSCGYSFFEKHRIKCRASNLGFVPAYRKPGWAVTEMLKEDFVQKGGKIRHCLVNGLLLNKNKVVGLVSGEEKIFGDVFVFAFGGLESLYSYSTSHLAKYNLLALALEAGFKLENLEFNMFHPFLIIDSKLPRTVISGKLLQHMRFVDERGEEFLSANVKQALAENTHHGIFDVMAREFYLQSRKSRVFAIVESGETEFQNYVRQNEFGWVFEGKRLAKAKKFEIHSAFHYSLGGIKVNAKGRTCFENVFALGECATGLHGASRVGGTAVLECLVFGKIVADEIQDAGFGALGKKFKRKCCVPSISEREKALFWKFLGPVKDRQKLQQIVESSSENPYMKMLKECAISSLRTGNVGMNFVK